MQQITPYRFDLDRGARSVVLRASTAAGSADSMRCAISQPSDSEKPRESNGFRIEQLHGGQFKLAWNRELKKPEKVGVLLYGTTTSHHEIHLVPTGKTAAVIPEPTAQAAQAKPLKPGSYMSPKLKRHVEPGEDGWDPEEYKRIIFTQGTGQMAQQQQTQAETQRIATQRAQAQAQRQPEETPAEPPEKPELVPGAYFSTQHDGYIGPEHGDWSARAYEAITGQEWVAPEPEIKGEMMKAWKLRTGDKILMPDGVTWRTVEYVQREEETGLLVVGRGETGETSRLEPDVELLVHRDHETMISRSDSQPDNEPVQESGVQGGKEDGEEESEQEESDEEKN